MFGVGVDVLHDRGDPERRDAERLEVVEVVLDAEPVAPLVARERPGLDVEVVVHVAVGEAVDDDLVDDLVAPVLHVRREHGLLAVGGHLDAAELRRVPRTLRRRDGERDGIVSRHQLSHGALTGTTTS
jgi:hypothetical protein